MIKRKAKREVRIGSVSIGGQNTIAIQSMCNTRTSDIGSTVSQILELEKQGCEIIRVAVPDMDSAKACKTIRERIHIPLVADVHFDHRLALEAAKYVDKLRINPGNIGDKEKVRAVVGAAKKRGLPIRIGVNAGSLEKDIVERYGVSSDAMVESARRHISILEKQGFEDIVISLKSSSVPLTIEAYEKISASCDYPLHIGITEAGTQFSGTIRSCVGIGSLLSRGLGDTIRVSLCGNPEAEVKVAKEILSSLGLRQFGRVMIVCPTCGRTEIDLESLAKEVEAKTEIIREPIKIAVMGCIVNGLGEGKEADIGLAGGKGKAIIFRKGILVRKVEEKNAIAALLDETKKLLKEKFDKNYLL